MRDLVHEINSIEEIDEFRPVWHHLLSQSPDASFVQTPEWLETYWAHFGENQKLRVLIMAQDGETAAIVPFAVTTADTSLGKLRYLTLPWTSMGIGHRPIGPNPLHALTLAARHIRRTKRDWDIIDFRCVEPNAAERTKIKGALAHGGLNLTVRPWGEGSVVEFPEEGFDPYWRSRGVVVQQNVQRSDESLSRLGQLAFTRFRPVGVAELEPAMAGCESHGTAGHEQSHLREPAFDGPLTSTGTGDSTFGEYDPQWELLNACELIEDNSPTAMVADSSAAVTNIRPFQRDLHAVGTKSGNIDISMLSINEQPVGFAYHYVYGSRVEAVRLGFREDVDTTHAGMLLAHQSLQDSCVRGDRCYVNCTGSTNWLTDWQTKQFAGYRYTHFAPNAPRAQILRFNPWSSERVS